MIKRLCSHRSNYTHSFGYQQLNINNWIKAIKCCRVNSRNKEYSSYKISTAWRYIKKVNFSTGSLSSATNAGAGGTPPNRKLRHPVLDFCGLSSVNSREVPGRVCYQGWIFVLQLWQDAVRVLIFSCAGKRFYGIVHCTADVRLENSHC